jgi:hypothetical protein
MVLQYSAMNEIERMKRLPTECPSCGEKLLVRGLSCRKCGTEVGGSYELPPLASLGREDQEFVLQFVRASGSLKEMARLLRVSYPTVRNRLDDIIEKLKRTEGEPEERNG